MKIFSNSCYKSLNPNLSKYAIHIANLEFFNDIDLSQMGQLVNNLPVLSNPAANEGIFNVVSGNNDGNKISEQQKFTAN